MTKKVVTRFAPSPTGKLHIGGARTALFNQMFAKANGGIFKLRIEDTDRQRSDDKITKSILDDLRWLHLDWDEDIVYQSKHMDRHVEVANQLLEKGYAYKCFCTADELDQMRKTAEKEKRAFKYDGRWRDRTDHPDKPFVIRFKGNEKGVCEFNDMVRGKISISESELDDLVLLRSDGTPTYMLSVVVDDHDMGITHIIRGEDHLTNAAKQLRIYNAMGWDIPTFAHIPLIHGPDGRKLSKRHGAKGVGEYKDEGYLNTAFRNYLTKLGWSHPKGLETFGAIDAIDNFSIKRIGKSASCFDPANLLNMNAEYMAKVEDDQLSDLFGVMYEGEITDLHRKRLRNLMPQLKVRSKTMIHLIENAMFLFGKRPIQISDKAKDILDKKGAREILVKAHNDLTKVVDWDKDSLEKHFTKFVKSEKIKMGQAAQPVRAALTGSNVSPGIFDVLEVLGRDESLNRIVDIL